MSTYYKLPKLPKPPEEVLTHLLIPKDRVWCRPKSVPGNLIATWTQDDLRQGEGAAVDR